MGETQWREAEASGCAFARSRSARPRRSFASSPVKTANCASYSFRPKTTFSFNFLIEQFRSEQGYRNFRVHVLHDSACMPSGNKRRRLVDQKCIRAKNTIYFITDRNKTRHELMYFHFPPQHLSTPILPVVFATRMHAGAL